MTKIGLALSGGGFRATLYHLGLIRFLRDANILPQVTHITSVSGGSVTAAHLVLNWARYTGSVSDFEAAAAELLSFVRLDVRNRIARRFVLGFSIRWLRRLLGLSNRRLTRTGLLESHYEEHLFGDTSLFELPESPQLHILATNVSEGCLCSFNRNGLLVMRRRRPGTSVRVDQTRASLATVSMAVTASSAFPAFFPPLDLSQGDVGASGEFGRQAYTDGGIFDNLGVRMFRCLDEFLAADDFALDGVLISDVGKRIATQSQEELSGGLIRTSIRSSDILMDRVWQLETETFKDTPGFVFARIVDVVEPADDPTALHPEIQQQLPTIRTDMDRFSSLEISSLVRHGYCVGRKVCRAHPELFGSDLPAGAPWDPCPEPRSGASAPANAQGREAQHREATPVTTEARALHNSAIRRIWSTLLDYRDWTSYVYVPILVPILTLLPYFVVKFYERSQRNNQIVASLAQGSRDLQQMTKLLDSKSVPFSGVPFEPVDKAIEAERTGFEILQDSRIMDLRSWRPGDANSRSFGYRRLKVLKLPDYSGDNLFYATLIADHSETKVRFPPQELQPKLFRANLDGTTSGEKRYRWQAAYDFRQVPSGESVDLVVEYYSPGKYLQHSESGATLPIRIRTTTAEFIVWILLPTDKPYKSWRIVGYPSDEPDKVEKVKVVTEYLAEDSTILAFKMLSMKPGYLYEVQWFYK